MHLRRLGNQKKKNTEEDLKRWQDAEEERTPKENESCVTDSSCVFKSGDILQMEGEARWDRAEVGEKREAEGPREGWEG